MDTWLLKAVRIRETRRFVAWMVALVVVVVLVGGQARYIRNFFGGPFKLGPAELGAIKDADASPKCFVRVAGEDAADTGIEEISVTKNHGVETERSVSGTVYAIKIGERLLLAKGSRGPQKSAEGQLVPIPLDVSGAVFDTPDMQTARAAFYPFMLEETDYRTPGYWAIAGLLVFAFFFRLGAIPARRYMTTPSEHPLLAKVATWGDPYAISDAIERELPAPVFKLGNWTITDNYIVMLSAVTVNILRTQDLVWAYKKVIQHRTNFIPTGKTYEAQIICRDGTATVQAVDKVVDVLLEALATRAPWAVFGFSAEARDLYAKDPATFCQIVEERRRDAARQAAASP